MLNALTSNSKKLDKKIQGISVEKLIKDNPTITLMFENLESSNEVLEQKGKILGSEKEVSNS